MNRKREWCRAKACSLWLHHFERGGLLPRPGPEGLPVLLGPLVGVLLINFSKVPEKGRAAPCPGPRPVQLDSKKDAWLTTNRSELEKLPVLLERSD